MLLQITFDNVTIIISLLIAFVSLIVSVIALKIAQSSFNYSSKDYTPNIHYQILDNDEIEILNKSRKIFKIDYINYLKIKIIGFEDHEKQAIIQFPLVINSKVFRWVKNEGKQKKIRFGFNDAGPCAYICPYDEKIVSEIQEIIRSTYSIESKKGYALPSLQSVKYFVELVYTDPFMERKSLIFEYAHIHGHGFDKVKISEERLKNYLNKANLPKFENAQDLLNYVIEKHSTRGDEYFSNL